jgi:sugar phosphate permease
MATGQPAHDAGADAPAMRASAYRWVVLGVAWLVFLMSLVDRAAWGPAATAVGTSLALPVAALGIFATAFYAGYVVCNALGGLASDRLGGRLTLSISALSLGICTFAFGFAQSLAAGLVLQALMGLAAGADYASCVKILVAWFDRRSRGTAMGLFMTATSLGVVVANLSVPRLLMRMPWESVYHLAGGVTMAAAVLAFILLRDAPAGREADNSGRLSLAALVRDRDLLFMALAGFGALWGTWGFIAWANALMTHGRGLSAVDAGLVVTLFSVTAIPGKPLVGVLSDWLGGRRKLLIILCLALFAVMLIVFSLLGTRTEFLVAAPLLGLGAFVYSPLTAALVAEISGPALAGSATGLTAALWQLGSAIVPTVVGVVLGRTGSFTAAVLVLAAGPLFGVCCMLSVRESRGAS